MDFMAVQTEILILLLLLSTLVTDLAMAKGASRRPVAYLTAAGLAAILAHTCGLYHEGASPVFYMGLFLADNYALFFKQLFLLGMVFTVLFSLDYVERCLPHPGEFYSLLLSALLGMCVMASANDFLTAFTGLELMTVSFYILVGFRLSSADSGEAAVKYLIVGAGSTAVMLYGISLVYGAGGSLDFAAVSRNVHLFTAVGLAGVVLVMAGFLFKLSAIPFHMWAPDVYQGAPTPVTALLAMASKAAGIAVFMRVIFTAFPYLGEFMLPLLKTIAALSMIGGNLLAIRQTDVKRMLAYSSIAQAGYMMAGIVAADYFGMKAAMFYAMLYVFANIGAFAVLSVVDAERGGTSRRHVTGLSQAAPMLAAVMTISLLSMAGIPPTAGFAGKIYIFTATVERGNLWLAVIGFVMSMISVYYYLQVTKAMYRDLEPGEETLAEPLPVPSVARAAALVSAAATLAIGICPESLAVLTNFASQTFMQ